jgi:hypothetical protein
MRPATLWLALAAWAGLCGCHDLGAIKPAIDGAASAPDGSDAIVATETRSDHAPDDVPSADGGDAIDAAPADGSGADAPGSDGSAIDAPAADGNGADAPAADGSHADAPDAGCQGNDGCPQGSTCLLTTHACVPTSAIISGQVRRYESTDPTSSSAGVKVLVTNVKSPPTSTSDDGGHYALSGVPLRSIVNFELSLAEQQVTSVTPPVPVPVVLATRTSDVLGDAATNTIDLPFVSYAWLANVAYQCGLFATAAEAATTLNTVSNTRHVNFYFTQRSTVIGTLLGSGDKPMSGVSRGSISISMAATSMAPFPNKDTAPTAAEPYPPRVCFLDADQASGQFVGTKADASTSTGKFIVFRVQNTRGTGEGTATVRATGFVSESVILPSTGNIGVVALRQGQDAIPVEMNRSFERDVYPLFTKYVCIGCHSPGNDGFTMSKPRGAMSLRLDLSDTPMNVWLTLTTGGFMDCADTTPARVCPPSPDASLLLKKPLAETGDTMQDHANTSFQTTADPDYRIIADWIKQGAMR